MKKEAKTDRSEEIAEKHTEQREPMEKWMADVFSLFSTALDIHTDVDNMTKDFNLAARTPEEDKFIRKQMSIMKHVYNYLDPAKIDRQYKRYHKCYKPTENEMKKEKEEIEKMRRETIKMLMNDVHMINVLSRNREGVVLRTVLKSLNDGVREERDKKSAIPILGDLLKKKGEEEK